MTDNLLTDATQNARIANSVIDLTAILILWFFIISILARLELHQIPIAKETGDLFEYFALGILIATFIGYYVILESINQKTLGKIITKTKVVTNDGEKPSLARILMRTLCRLIPFEYFSYLVTVNGLHDRLSRTRVVKWYS